MRVWFNHWFSTAYYYMQSLKEQGNYIIASNKNEDCVYKLIADEFYVEPKEDDNYVEYCKKFIKEHSIDVFFVRRCMIDISKVKEDLGCKVVCDDIDKIEVFQYKDKTAEFFRANNICPVPEYRIVNTAKDFKIAYAELSIFYDYICIKYNVDEGGKSYKLISPHKPNINRIKENNGLVYSYDYIVRCLSSVRRFDDIIVMPYLDGKEISIDCIGTNNGLIAVKREKMAKRVTIVSKNTLDCVNKFYSLSGLEMPFNIQFRISKGVLYLLEVNTRLSGGAYKAKELGIDFSDLALNKVLNNDKEVKFTAESKKLISLEDYRVYE